MKRTYIKNLQKLTGNKVKIAGSVNVKRDHGKLIFIDLRDATGKVQMVALPNHENAYKLATALRAQWVIEATGVVNKRPAKMVNEKEANGNIEIEITSMRVLSEAKELPFDIDVELNLDTYLDYLPLSLRNKKGRAVFKVQAEIIKSFRLFLNDKGFTEFQSPKIIGEDAEGGASSFDVEYFGKTAHLAQSPQLYKQIMVGIFEKVFTTGNVYRAEKHSTSRHINEYTSLDLEFGFIKDHRDVMNLINELLIAINGHLKETCKEEFEFLKAEFPKIPKEIPYMKLREAQKIISIETDEELSYNPDLDPQEERTISEYAQKQLDSDFIFITHYPVEKRPMYTYEDEEDPGFTKSFDLLFRGVEILTGSQRIHNYDKLVESMKRKGLNPEKFSFFLQAFKYGMPPHGGMGMGLERLTSKFLGIKNVKEATLFPREINRIDILLSKSDDDQKTA